MSATDLIPPACRARFRPEKRLAAGGFGSIWLATQLDLDRQVVLKVLHGTALGDADQVERFVNEARIAAALSHQNIVTLFDHGIDGGIPWIAYEYVPGPDLRQVGGRLTVAEVLLIGVHVCQALEEAHGHGVIHRDIKPENILRARPDLYKVTDFGISKWGGSQRTLTADGLILGTPAYLSPLLIRGEPADPTTDIYALGVTLYELIAGRPPFLDEDPRRMLDLHLNAKVPPLSGGGDMTPAVADAIGRSLAKSREENYPTAAAFRTVLMTAGPIATPGDVPVVTTDAKARHTERRLKHPAPSAVTLAVRNPPRGVPWAPIAAAALGVCVLLIITMYLRMGTPRLVPAAVKRTHPAMDPLPLLFGETIAIPQDCLHTIAAGGTVATNLVNRLQLVVPYPVGKRAQDWIYWFQLNRWLSNPDSAGDPPPGVSSSGKAVDVLQTLNLENVMGEFGRPGRTNMDHELLQRIASAWPSRLDTLHAIAVETVRTRPNHPYGWLLLGRLLELERRPEAAQQAYRWALLVPPRGTEPYMPLLLWTSLLRAFERVPGHSLEKDLSVWAERGGEAPTPWLALVEMLHKDDPARLLRLFEQGSCLPKSGGAAAAGWGEYVLRERRNPGQATAVWMSALMRFPRSPALNARVANYHMTRGHLAVAAPFVKLLPPGYREGEVFRFLDPDRRMAASDLSSLPEENQVYLLLETGNQLAAEKVALKKLETAFTSQRVRPAHFELMGAGSKLPQLPNIIRNEIRTPRRDQPASMWRDAAGALSSPAAQPLMMAILTEGELLPHPFCPRGPLRALWLSRCGRLRESITALVSVAPALSAGEDFTVDLYEIACRPQWRLLCGRGDAELCAQASRIQLPERNTPWGEYRDHLLKHELPQAARIAQEQFELNPGSAFWQLAGAWTSAAQPGHPGFTEWVARVKMNLRYFGKGLWIAREMDAILQP